MWSRSLHDNKLTGSIPTTLNNIVKGGSFNGLNQLYVSLPHWHRVTLGLRCYFICIFKLLDHLMFHSSAYNIAASKNFGCLESSKEEAAGLKKYQSLCSSVSICYCGQSCRSQQSDRNCAQLQCSWWPCICVSPLKNMHEFTLRCSLFESLMWPGSKLLMPIPSLSPLQTFHEIMHCNLWGIKNVILTRAFKLTILFSAEILVQTHLTLNHSRPGWMRLQNPSRHCETSLPISNLSCNYWLRWCLKIWS